MESVALSDLESSVLEVVEKVQRTGEPVLITRSGEPLAEIVPVTTTASGRPKHWLGSFRSTGKILGDIISPTVEESAWDVLRP